METRYVAFILVIFSFVVACKDEEISKKIENPSVLVSKNITVNPTGYAPLSAFLSLETNKAVTVSVTVLGKNSPQGDITHIFDEIDTTFSLPIHGLYPDYNNQLKIDFLESGKILNSDTITIRTQRKSSDLPIIEIETPHSEQQQTILRFVNYFGFNRSLSPQRAFVFDQFGDIRWYLDFEGHPTLGRLFFDNGPSILQNGNLIMGDINSGSLYEVSFFGELRSTFPLRLNGFSFHHEVIEKPNGNFLLTANKLGRETVEDEIIEVERSTKKIINNWDLTQSLDPSRYIWPSPNAGPNIEIDWFHGNAVRYSESDNCILVSGRTQGVFKLTQNNDLVWILAPHADWKQERHQTKLLQPLDKNGALITDVEVLNGTKNHPDFEWAWYQHDPTILPNGDILLFDNGENRNFSEATKYSRAVQYRIDEQNMTIQQVWSYGKSRGSSFYSQIVSNAVPAINKQNYLINPGAIDFAGRAMGKTVEVNISTNEVVFEATLFAPNNIFNIIFHNVRDFEF